MKKSIKILFVSLLFFLFSANLFSQWSVSGYSAAYPKVGVAYNFSDRWWSEVRIMTTIHVFDINPEMMMNFNFIKQERYNVYFGGGFTFNTITGIVLPLGLQFIPFKEYNNFSLHLEIEPTIMQEAVVLVQPSWGIRYRF